MIQIFEDQAILFLDLQHKKFIRKEKRSEFSCVFPIEQADALKKEISSFIDAIRHGRPPVFSGEDWLSSFEISLPNYGKD